MVERDRLGMNSWYRSDCTITSRITDGGAGTHANSVTCFIVPSGFDSMHARSA